MSTEPAGLPPLVDTNILVYAYDSSDPDKQKIAAALLEKCWLGKTSYAVSLQNLAEFFFVVTKKIKNPFPVAAAHQLIKDIISFPSWKVIHYDADILNDAILLYAPAKKDFWEVILVATMINPRIFTVLTENVDDFKNYPIIIVINPFES